MAEVWVAGRLVPAESATIPYDDHGITVGDGVFETVKIEGPAGTSAGTSGAAPFHLARHVERLRRSADAMAIPWPGRDEVDRAVAAVLETHDGGTAFLRITLTAGRGPLGTPRGELAPHLIVAVRPGHVRVEPTDVVVVPWTRNERGALAGVKSTSYGENVVALVHASRSGADEALFANTVGDLCEGTGSNVFVGFGTELLTPRLASGCLDGITRALLLEAGVGTEADIPIGLLADADEAFLVSTGREVQPVRRIDGRTLPRCPGPLTTGARDVWVHEIAAT